MVEFILKDIDDPKVRENFVRLLKYLNSQTILQGDFEFMEVVIPQATSKFTLKHGLSFTPQDVVVLSVEGNFHFYFRYQEFDKTNIYITTSGPVRIRFLLGLYTEQAYSKGKQNFTLVAPT